MRRKAQLWIFSADRKFALLLKRTPAFGSILQPVTGTVEQDESFLEGAIREGEEETGFRLQGIVQPIDFSFEFEDRFGGDGARATEQVFFAVLPKDGEAPPSPSLDPKEHDGFEWVALDQVLARLPFEMQRQAFRETVARVQNV